MRLPPKKQISDVWRGLHGGTLPSSRAAGVTLEQRRELRASYYEMADRARETIGEALTATRSDGNPDWHTRLTAAKLVQSVTVPSLAPVAVKMDDEEGAITSLRYLSVNLPTEFAALGAIVLGALGTQAPGPAQQIEQAPDKPETNDEA